MSNFSLWPEQASTLAPKVDALVLFETAFGSFIILTFCLVILAFCIHYRRGNKADRSNPPTQSPTAEIGWFVVAIITTGTMFTWATRLFFEEYTPIPGASRIDVVGKQWMWYVQHPEGRSETNELHVPVGRPFKLNMTSQDVVHSFFIPAFRVKQDVVPGIYTGYSFIPSKVGVYDLFCAEYCGTNHSRMIGYVHVMEPEDYEAWLAEKAGGPSQADEGEKLFVKNHCAGCHRGSQIVHAPRLEGVYGRPVPIQVGSEVHFKTADETYIRDSILIPKQDVVAGYEPIMPSFKDQISEQDLLKIIAYIKSLANREVSQ